ncbi:MAG: type II secretion system protein [Lentisphaerae bacterium]|nr:type II secretion system protein [Lentisphaerota bacterium]
MIRIAEAGYGAPREDGRRRRGFTLIEMLVVVAIIALLVGILLPAIGAARQYAKRQRARSEVRQIELAWKSFLNDYRELPSGITEMDNRALEILNGENSGANPRETRYMEFDAGATQFRDPWGEVYQVELDDDLDNQVDPRDYSVTLDRNVAVWSYGLNGAADTPGSRGDDDIRSWK